MLDFSIFSCIGHISGLAFERSPVSLDSDGTLSANPRYRAHFGIPKNTRKLRYQLEEEEGFFNQELTSSRHNDEAYFTTQAHKSFKLRVHGSGNSNAVLPVEVFVRCKRNVMVTRDGYDPQTQFLKEECLMKTNTQLQHDVIDELQFEPSIDAANIGVIAQDGIVTLTGKVNNYAEKYAASEAAERVGGVKAVIDETKVDLPLAHQRDDRDIAKAALSALKWHVWVPKDAIKVKVEQGWVTLEGTVDYKFQQMAAGEAVQDLTGVTGASNLITIKSVVAPADLKVRIENALSRAAELDSERIKVEVDGNKVVLRGKVSSWAERDEAERAAWSAPGVWDVDDKIEIAA